MSKLKDLAERTDTDEPEDTDETPANAATKFYRVSQQQWGIRQKPEAKEWLDDDDDNLVME